MMKHDVAIAMEADVRGNRIADQLFQAWLGALQQLPSDVNIGYTGYVSCVVLSANVLAWLGQTMTPDEQLKGREEFFSAVEQATVQVMQAYRAAQQEGR